MGEEVRFYHGLHSVRTFGPATSPLQFSLLIEASHNVTRIVLDTLGTPSTMAKKYQNPDIRLPEASSNENVYVPSAVAAPVGRNGIRL